VIQHINTMKATNHVMIAPQRRQMQSRFSMICERYPKWMEVHIDVRDRIVRHMERNCFAVAVEECKALGINRLFTEPRFIARYSAVCSKILANLDTTGSVGSTYLIDRIITGEVDPHTIAGYNSIELCPEASREERESIERRQCAKSELKVSHAYTCPKCYGNETLPIKYQGRAADEDCSISIKCVKCSMIWKKR
jgi:DNA-directed RNA polymerase subunit M/transcription elongation factor TFIIS